MNPFEFSSPIFNAFEQWRSIRTAKRLHYFSRESMHWMWIAAPCMPVKEWTCFIKSAFPRSNLLRLSLVHRIYFVALFADDIRAPLACAAGKGSEAVIKPPKINPLLLCKIYQPIPKSIISKPGFWGSFDKRSILCWAVLIFPNSGMFCDITIGKRDAPFWKIHE